ncbi:MAG: hypothetical protein ACPIFP_05915 [Candidatus Poseidoniaceae archaeon]
MEARRPGLARVSGIAALLLGALMIINAFAGRWPGHPGMKFRVQPYVLARLDRFDGTWWAPTGWYHQETAVGVVIVALFLIRRNASKPRPVPTIQQRSISAQLEDFESGGVTVRSAPQIGGASATTQAIVQSIIGGEAEAQGDVTAAIAHLDADETGQEAARVVAAAKMPQRAIVREAKPLETPPINEVALPAKESEPSPEPNRMLDLPLPEPAQPTSTPTQAAPSTSPSVPLPVLPDVNDPPVDDADIGADLMGLLDGLDDLFDAPAEDAPRNATDNGMGDLLDSLDDLF